MMTTAGRVTSSSVLRKF